MVDVHDMVGEGVRNIMSLVIFDLEGLFISSTHFGFSKTQSSSLAYMIITAPDYRFLPFA